MTLSRSLFLFLFFAQTANAEAYKIETVGYGQSNDYFEALAGNLQVYKSDFTYDRYEYADDARLKIASGRCFGSFIIINGEPNGGGNCVFTDVNGDKVLQAWNLDEVALGVGHGTYYLIGGTGAHEGISGRGYYTNELVSRTGETRTTISGTISWPD